MKQVIVTTSWDDGHKLDVRLSALLHKYNLPGTFYVSPHDREFPQRELLSDAQVKVISESFEIGAHTMTHPRLTKISDDEAYQEIIDSKHYLERVIGQKITSFCYPGGNYKKKHVRMMATAGFIYARTVKRHTFNLKGSLLEAGTTVNAYSHYQDLWKIARFAHFNPIKTVLYFRWDRLAKAMFDHAQADGGIYHLWGHSWEIDQHHDWQKLESVLKYISGRDDVIYTTNSELVEYQPKRLLMATPYFPPHLGGVEFYAYHLSQSLQNDLGWYVCVVTTGHKGWRPVRSMYNGLRVYHLPYWFKVSNTPYNPLWSFWLRRIIKREDIYIIDAHAPVPVFADLATRVAKRLPVVVSYHMMSMAKGKTNTDRLISVYEELVLPAMLKRADSIICSSNKVRDIFLSQFRYKSQTITPGVDTTAFKPVAERPEDTLLFVGSLNKSDNHKGVTYLLEAFHTILKTNKKTQLLIVGEGSGRSNYEAMAKKLGIEQAVQFLGGKYEKGLADTYRQASIFVLPTLNDSFPLVILEAMATGLPVVSTRVGGIPSMVDDGQTGYLVAPANSAELAEKLKYLLDNPDVATRFGKKGRAKVVSDLTWNLQAIKTDDVLLKSLRGLTGKNS